jgi:RecA/RadA recombinase
MGGPATDACWYVPQICLQLLLAAQLPARLGGLGGSAVYISTEGRLPKCRLQQMAAAHPKFGQYYSQPDDSDFTSGADPCAHLLIKQADTADELAFVLRQLPTLVQKYSGVVGGSDQVRSDGAAVQPSSVRGGGADATPPPTTTAAAAAAAAATTTSMPPIRLVVVDSIAAPYRSQSLDASQRHRHVELLAHAATLKRLAETVTTALADTGAAAAAAAAAAGEQHTCDGAGIAVVLINQVTAVMSDGFADLRGMVGAAHPGAPSSRSLPTLRNCWVRPPQSAVSSHPCAHCHSAPSGVRVA